MAARTSITINRKGGCTCGAVEFEVNGPMHYSALCHCRSCSYSRATSPVHCVGIARADLKFTKGEDQLKEVPTYGKVKHVVCQVCSTGLFEQSAGFPDRCAVFPVNFHIVNGGPDSKDCKLPEELRPQAHVNYENRLYDHDDSLPKFLHYPQTTPHPVNSDGTPVKPPAAKGIGAKVLARRGAPDTAMPLVGLGTWQAPAGQVQAAVLAAIRAGYRHIDGAAVYGNEKEVGAALKEAFDSGLVTREELFITSKLWNSEHAPQDVEAALRVTLADLGLDYLDLYLIHWPQAFAHVDGSNRSFPRTEDGGMAYDVDSTHEMTWKALEATVDAGLTRHLGLSNFTSAQIAAVLAVARIPPQVLQVEVHPFFQQEPLVEFARARGIVVTGYSPLGSGSVVDGHIVPLHPKLKEIGAKYEKTAAQVALRQQMQRGIVVIPKSVKAGRIAENIDLDFTLSDEDMAALAALDKGIRTGWGGPTVDRDGEKRPRDELHPAYPFKMGPDGQNDGTVF